MSLLAESMSALALVPLDVTVLILKPALVSNPNLMGEVSANWSSPTTLATVLGHLEPAGTRALERVGRIGKNGVHELTTEPTTIVPQGRVSIADQQYLVLDVRLASTHAFAIIEEVDM